MRHPIENLSPIVTLEELLKMQELVKSVYVSPAVKKYIIDLVKSTRQSKDIYLGASPRGSIGIFKSIQARAAIQGRDYVLPDDVKALAESVLAHRIMVDPSARLRDISSNVIVQETLRTLPVPGGDLSGG
jgi:MoxR-like ATPase